MLWMKCYWSYVVQGEMGPAWWRHKALMNWINFGSAWWRHQMEPFSALLAICAGNSPVTGDFPSQRQVTRSFDVFLELRLNKRLSKQWWGWWFETPLLSLWRHCNGKWLVACSVPSHCLKNSSALSTGTSGTDSREMWVTEMEIVDHFIPFSMG